MHFFFSGDTFVRKRTAVNIANFLFGALGYGMIEILWRGRTHISMLFLGGLCFSFIRCLEGRSKKNILLKALFSALFITGTEFAAGCAVNLWWRLNVWDYSAYRLNLLGQICLLYSVLWFFLSFAVLAAMRILGYLYRRIRLPVKAKKAPSADE